MTEVLPKILEKTGKVLKTGAVQTGEALHKFVDAIILDVSPHGTVVDGAVRLDGEIAKDAFKATVGNTGPHGTVVDGAVRLDGEFVKDAVNATVLDKSPHGTNVGTF
jgi:hypothetical protein